MVLGCSGVVLGFLGMVICGSEYLFSGYGAATMGLGMVICGSRWFWSCSGWFWNGYVWF